jgi:integrase
MVSSHLIELRNLAILLTLALTGLRVETFRTLTQDQVVQRPGGYAVHIRNKNEVEFRDVPLSDEAYAAIEQWLALRLTPRNLPWTSPRIVPGTAPSSMLGGFSFVSCQKHPWKGGTP